jgi:hypothetical protein
MEVIYMAALSMSTAIAAAASAEEAFHGSNLHPYTEADTTAATSAVAASTDKVFLRFGGHMPLFFYFLFFHIRYITEHGTEGSHHTILYDEAGVL